MGVPADFIWSIASLVCLIIPSSAATTNTAISVIWAPLARIAVNASWPGVSTKVIFSLLWVIWYAPILWVIPPCSESTTFDPLIASNIDVFPWSTWPKIVITGDLKVIWSSFKLEESNSDFSVFFESLFGFKTLNPNSWATRTATSNSMISLMFAITPWRINSLITSEGGISIISDKSPAVSCTGKLRSFSCSSIKLLFLSTI